ncbi:PEPxxWA-CTERM sorting domain-containing protein [Sphingomonas sp.]|uniref:PEPxxWA-CTERM sorting domain-containing protein n=1 Tax=Sphingomonas sp. TaxID=28214 RepID=UPI0025EEBE38|nr:PEPxxWA-CTERM sorting domain-containing protein [Sphingomonas sp.]
MRFDKRVLAIAGGMSAVAIAAVASAHVPATARSSHLAAPVATSGKGAFRDGPMTTFTGAPAPSGYGAGHGASAEALEVAAWNAKVIRATDQLAADRGGSFSGASPDDIVREASAAGLDRAGDAAADQRAKAKAAPAHLPEPATWGMLILGFGGIGFGLRRAHQRSEAKFNEKIKRITNGLPD